MKLWGTQGFYNAAWIWNIIVIFSSMPFEKHIFWQVKKSVILPKRANQKSLCLFIEYNRVNKIFKKISPIEAVYPQKIEHNSVEKLCFKITALKFFR